MNGDLWTIIPGALDEKLGIVIEEQSVQKVVATMPVAGNTQSLGRLHGGASAAFAEALGSWATMIHASTMGRVCVGVDLNITHHRGAVNGIVRGTATPLHLGRRAATYEVTIEDAGGQRLATARITSMIMNPQ